MSDEKTGMELEIVDPNKRHIGVSQRGIQIETANALVMFAQKVVASRLAPRGMDEAAVFVAIQTGMERGLTPMASLQALVVIEGQLSWRGQAALALIRASGQVEPGTLELGTEGDGDQMYGYCRSRRKGYSKPVTNVFTVQDAKTAGLWGKSSRDGKAMPWTTFPKRQLMWRAVGFHARDHYSDVLGGFPIAEELDGEETKHGGQRGPVELPAPAVQDPLLDEFTEETAQTSAPAPDPPSEESRETQSSSPVTAAPDEDRSPEQPEPAQDDHQQHLDVRKEAIAAGQPVSPESDIDEALGPADEEEEPAGKEPDPIEKLYDACQVRVGKDSQALHDLWIEVTDAVAAAGDNVDAGWEKLNSHPVFGLRATSAPEDEKREIRAPEGPKKEAVCSHWTITKKRLYATPANKMLVCPRCGKEFRGQKAQETLL